MNVKIIDVREPDEFFMGHYDGAVNIPLSTIPDNPTLKNISKDSPLVLYCRSGGRSEQALQILKKQGYTNLTNGISQQFLESSK